jgi:hypothetical protein
MVLLVLYWHQMGAASSEAGHHHQSRQGVFVYPDQVVEQVKMEV